MMRTKPSYNQKIKLTLQQKVNSRQNYPHFLLRPNFPQITKPCIKPARNSQANHKQFKNRSNSFKKHICISIGSLKSRKIVLVGKQNVKNVKIEPNLFKEVPKPSLKLIYGNDVIDPLKQQKATQIGSGCSQKFQSRKAIKSDLIKQKLTQKDVKFSNTAQSSQFSQSDNRLTLKLIDNQDFNPINQQSVPLMEFGFNNFLSSQLKQNPDIRLSNTKINSIVKSSIKQSIVVQNNGLCLRSAVFSIKIDQNIKQCSKGKVKLVQQCIDDPQFEWKFTKYKQYAQKYTEHQMKIKQNFSTLQFLTQNLDLLKQRITPFKSIDSLKQIIQILRPTLRKKEKYAYEIKMRMLQWKKKFFTNVNKIRQSFNQNIDEKYQTVFAQLHDNENKLQKMINLLGDIKKKETVNIEKQVFQNLSELLQPILINQKSIIDEINLCQRNGELLLAKFNNIEEEWSHTFDIFNSTLQNCVNKCFVVSECIEQLYGRSTNDLFLTKGFQAQDQRDSKTLQNDNCHICRWNEIKLKKIIAENTLANDHLKALKHLIAN